MEENYISLIKVLNLILLLSTLK